MPFIHQRITIISSRRPLNPTVNDELQWLGSSLGLFGDRDKDKSAFRVFLELVKATKRGLALSSDDIADTLGLSRGAVIHHINKMMEAGIVVHDGRRYWLREPRLESLIDELKKDVERNIEDLRRAAKEIDSAIRQ